MSSKPRLFTAREFISAMAYNAVCLDPLRTPRRLDELTKALEAYCNTRFQGGVAFLRMEYFNNPKEIEIFLETFMKDDPIGAEILELWNTPRSGHTAPVIFASSFTGRMVKPEDDFIDIDCLLRDTSRLIWKLCEPENAGLIPSEPPEMLPSPLTNSGSA